MVYLYGPVVREEMAILVEECAESEFSLMHAQTFRDLKVIIV
jgi:hypothetical protein